MPKFNVEVEVSDQFALDVMVTMVESAYDWFTFRNVVRNDDLDVLSFEVADSEELMAHDGDDDSYPWETITALSVNETIKDFFEKRPVNDMVMGYITSAIVTDDAGDIDADAADCLLQWAVFDQVVYG